MDHEYYRKAAQAYREAAEGYRSLKIDDVEFMQAVEVWKANQKEFDAERGEDV